MSRILFEREEKEGGDDSPIAFWKEFYTDTRLLHMKINAIGKEVGVSFLHAMGYYA